MCIRDRRWRASQLAGQDKIPAMVRELPDEAAIAMALIENIQREDLNPIEEAVALQRLQQEFELTQQQVADAVGKSRVTITNLLRLIALPEAVSYTHLDVYKRQRLARSRPSRDADFSPGTSDNPHA